MTYLNLVNNVLRRLRETEVSTVAANSYSKLVGDLINDAKDLVEQGWAFLDFVKKIEFPITEEDMEIQKAYGNDPSNYGVYADEQSFNQQAYENDAHDDLPW